jgi:hypothetical protein
LVVVLVLVVVVALVVGPVAAVRLHTPRLLTSLRLPDLLLELELVQVALAV